MKEKRFRFKYRFTTTLMGGLLIFLVSNLFFIILIIFFIIDYYLYRTDKRLIYEMRKNKLNTLNKNISARYLDEIEHIFKENITKEDLKKNKLSALVSARIRIPVIKNFIKKFNVYNKNVLDIGCSSGAFTKLYLNNKNQNVLGIDLNLFSLKKARENKAKVILADTLKLPLKENYFDAVNFCEVIEHLSNPSLALKEINKVLKTNGVLLLTTNNRNAISILDVINPLIFMEKILGIYLNNILPLPNLFYGEGKNAYYHTEFSNKDISLLLHKAGFKIIYKNSTHIFYGKEFILNYLPFFVSPVRIAEILYKLEKIICVIPFLKYLGEHWEIVAEKIS